MSAREPGRSEQDQPRQGRRHDDRPERRADEASGVAVSKRQRLMQRWRQPLIGLGLAGLALPMVNASSVQEEAKPGKDTKPAENAPADPTAAAAASGVDTEDQLAGRIAETREQQERTRYVEGAVEKYGISRDLAEDIYDIAREENIEPRLAYGLVKTESTFDERAVSHVGARGLTQVMPRTAAWLMPGTKTADLYDRQTNLRLGFKYLDQMIDKYKGNVRLALLAYNRGPGTVDKVLKRGGDPNNGYADKVLGS